MLNFYFNGYDFFQYLKDGKWPDGMEPNGTIIPGLPAVENEVSTTTTLTTPTSHPPSPR